MGVEFGRLYYLYIPKSTQFQVNVLVMLVSKWVAVRIFASSSAGYWKNKESKDPR
jgi:hypothetical protein